VSASDTRIVACNVCGNRFALADLTHAQPSPFDPKQLLLECPLHGHTVTVPVVTHE
jgi:hypothetical protein